MAIYFLNMKTFGRAAGSSATSAIAYRAGERIHDERTGRVFDHSARSGVMHTEIMLPERLRGADMGWARDRANLWNAVEAAETRNNARVAREILVALPAELSPERRLALVRGFGRELVERHQFALDFAVHAPRTDPRNFHAHLLASTRQINAEGFGAKTALELSDAVRLQHGIQPFYEELIATRERWAALTNAALREAQIDARIDHRSLAAQGVEREPKLHLPRAVYEMERRGEFSILAERLRAEHQAMVEERVRRAEDRLLRSNSPAGDSQATIEGFARSPESRGREPPALQSMDEVRRQARENWLRIRQSQRLVEPQTKHEQHERDDGLGR